ncbi:hypothetical protein UM93_07435 [Psychromicrobium lacuslunae]|uniref:Uncharacterized protein n=1 Tax=Psychromicrobium lacuslunae TaxID=1618207 RepID=A0A0D4BY50_9MICC|nr:hypothetical protein UM93_07435 [Psychromicrobium lacuslunae]
MALGAIRYDQNTTITAAATIPINTPQGAAKLRNPQKKIATSMATSSRKAITLLTAVKVRVVDVDSTGNCISRS